MHKTPKQDQIQAKVDLTDLQLVDRAIFENDWQTMLQVFESGTDINCPVQDGLTALHVAAAYGRAEVVGKLLEYGANANFLSSRGHTALHTAAAHGDEKTVRALMKCTDLEIREPRDDYTAAHIAASSGRSLALTALCEEADVEAKTEDGETPFLCAMRYKNVACAKVLVEAGANVDARIGPNECTSLINAAANGDDIMVGVLLDLRADVDAVQSGGITAAIAATAKNNVRCLKLLIEYGANLDIMDVTGASALTIAVHWMSSEVALLILEHRVRINTTYTDHQVTLLHKAASRSLNEVLQKLLDRGADFNACDADGDPPLQWAVEKGNESGVETLIRAGADVNRVNSKTEAPVLSCAIKQGHENVIRLLLKYGAKPDLVDFDSLQPSSETSSPVFEACKRLAGGNLTAKDQEILNAKTGTKVNTQEQSTQKLPEATRLLNPHGNIRYQTIDIASQVRRQSLIASHQDIVQHPGVYCDGPYCVENRGKINIVGIRYSCATCESVNFCAKCVTSWEISHNATHPMIRCLLPTEFEKIKDIDDFAKTSLLQKLAPGLNAADVAAIITARLEASDRQECLPATLFDDHGPDIIILRHDPDPKPHSPKEITIYEEQSSNGYIDFYTIDENFNVRMKAQNIDEKPGAKLQGDDLIQHHSIQLTQDVLFGRLNVYDYRCQPEFYQMANEQRLVTRVIDILPGKFDDKLDIRLRTVDISQAAYTALSYTWRATNHDRALLHGLTKEASDTVRAMANFKYPVYIQGNEQSYLPIGPGLHDALQRFRSESEIVCLWADQVSINQADVSERSFQVQNMRYIYHRAERVVCWIGEEEESTEQVFDTLRKIAGAVELLGFEISPETLLNDEVLDLPPPESPLWGSIIDHLMRPVFGRCWVIQEIVVAQKVVIRCGRHTIDWDELAFVVKILASTDWYRYFFDTILRSVDKVTESHSLPHMMTAAILQINGLREDYQNHKELTLEALVYTTASYEATDPVDKIYSLLGIQSGRHSPWLAAVEPDYSLSVQEAFTKSTRAIIRQAGTFAIWGLNDTISSKRISDLPSWVPDYSFEKETSLCLNRPIPTIPYCAGGKCDLIASWPYEERHPNLLATSSFKVATVLQISQQVWPDNRHDSRGPVVTEWTTLGSMKPPSISGEELAQRFTRTLVANCTFQWRQQPLPASYHTAIAAYFVTVFINYMEEMNKDSGDERMSAMMHQLLFDAKNILLADGDDDNANNNNNTYTRTNEDKEAVLALTASARRRCFITSDGYFCIGPRDMQMGDEVHVFPGSPTPFVLRRVTGDGGNSSSSSSSEGKDKQDNDDDDNTTKKMELELELAEKDDKILYSLVGECFHLGVMDGQALEQDNFVWTDIYMI